MKRKYSVLLSIIAILSSLWFGYNIWNQNTQMVVSEPGSIQISIYGRENIPNYDWVTGNVKGWSELDWVPYKVEILNGREESVKFIVSVEHDYYQGTYLGIDDIRNTWVYRDGVGEAAVVTPTYLDPTTYTSGTQNLVYDWTITVASGENCTLWLEAHLAVGSHEWSGATVHTTIGTITTNPDVPIPSGVKTIPIMVEDNPDITIRKKVGESNTGPWYDANTPGSAVEIDYLWDSPSDVYYRIELENTGNVALTGLLLTDTIYDVSSVILPSTFNPGDTFTAIIGPYTVQDGTNTNTATISTEYKGETISDEDPAIYIGYYAGITVSKDADTFTSTVFDYFIDSTPFTLQDYNSGNPARTFWLLPGTYIFEELPETGWILSDIGHSTNPQATTSFTKDIANRKITVELARGEWVSVWFQNTEIQRGTIIVEKQTIPDQHIMDFEFTGNANGVISDGEQIIVSGLLPGEYTSTEIVPIGWELKSITVDDSNSIPDKASKTVTFKLEEGETVKAVFTNEKEKDEPDPWEAKIKVRKVDSENKPIEGWMITLVQIDKYTDSDGYVVFQINGPNTYSIVEETRPGWIPMGATMVDITVTEEKTYEYTFKNQKVPDFVVPEYPLGTILALITMFSAMIITKNKHKINI